MNKEGFLSDSGVMVELAEGGISISVSFLLFVLSLFYGLPLHLSLFSSSLFLLLLCQFLLLSNKASLFSLVEGDPLSFFSLLHPQIQLFHPFIYRIDCVITLHSALPLSAFPSLFSLPIHVSSLPFQTLSSSLSMRVGRAFVWEDADYARVRKLCDSLEGWTEVR